MINPFLNNTWIERTQCQVLIDETRANLTFWQTGSIYIIILASIVYLIFYLLYREKGKDFCLEDVGALTSIITLTFSIAALLTS